MTGRLPALRAHGNIMGGLLESVAAHRQTL